MKVLYSVQMPGMWLDQAINCPHGLLPASVCQYLQTHLGGKVSLKPAFFQDAEDSVGRAHCLHEFLFEKVVPVR